MTIKEELGGDRVEQEVIHRGRRPKGKERAKLQQVHKLSMVQAIKKLECTDMQAKGKGASEIATGPQAEHGPGD